MKSNFLVIGGSGGIGHQLIHDLAPFHNLLVGKHINDINLNSEYHSLPVEATNSDSVYEFINKGIDLFGKVDGIINLAGNLILKPPHIATEDDYQKTIDVNLKSSFYITRHAGKLLTDCSVVFMSTAAANIGLANHELICMAKAGVKGLTLSAAKTYARKNIRFNTVSPGLVNTPLAKSIVGNPIAKKASEKMHALNRIGEPKDISNMIIYLLDKENNWITGQDFIVDGGLSSTK